jgi:retron-type reverse transcriptase
MHREFSMESNWRARLEAIGKQNFILEEMLRLGFITQEEMKIDDELMVHYKALLEEISEASNSLGQVRRVIAESTNVEKMVRQVRQARIKRIREAREQKNIAKARLREQRAEDNAERKRDRPTFFGRGYSYAVSFDKGAPSSPNLPKPRTFMELAGSLGLTTPQLQWLVYHRQVSSSDHYSRFEIPKRNGKTRIISSPKPAMRKAQSWIRENILSQLKYHDAAMAFRPSKSIVDNARIHAESSVIIRIDLKDFFPSIGFGRVLNLFQSLGYNGGVATVLALICTDSPRAKVVLDGLTQWAALAPRSLPQGAVTSPDLANLIAYNLDTRLSAYAEKSGWVYTRYADDLVLSTKATKPNASGMVSAVTKICEGEGFQVNNEKTRIMRNPRRQTVTGLVVNDGKVRLSRKDLRRIRAFLHKCETQGLEQTSKEIGKDAMSVAKGYFAYAFMVNPEAAIALTKKHQWLS